MSATTNEEVLQMISFQIPHDAQFNDSRRLKRSLRHFSRRFGWSHIYWGRDLNERNTLKIYVRWESSQDALEFSGCHDLTIVFSPIALPPISATYVNLHGPITQNYPSEVVIFYFKDQDLTIEDETSFAEQACGTAEMLRVTDSIMSMANGWMFGDVHHNGASARAYVMIAAWSSLDALQQEKQDEHSTFKNAFAPLKGLASLGTETFLHTSLSSKSRNVGGRGCTIW